MIGGDDKQKEFWIKFFSKVEIIPFDKDANLKAVEIFQSLKKSNKLIEVPDIFIGATALSRNLSLATLNKKHFERLKGLELI